VDVKASEEPSQMRLYFTVGIPLAEADRRLILATLDEYGGDKRKAAAVLGISLKTLYNRLNEYGFEEKSPCPV